MATAFQVSLTNPTTGLVDVTDQDNILTIKDWSNYSAGSPEPGHSQADFDQYRRMKLTLPTGTMYLLSSLYPAEGDITLPVPAGQTLPISTDYNYNTGDGRYTITLYVLPTWGAGYAYLLADGVYVYRPTNGKIYKCIQNGTGKAPESYTDYWTEVTSPDSLPAKYLLTTEVVVVSDMKECWARRVYNVLCLNHALDPRFDKLVADEEFLDAMRLCLSINALPVLLKLSAWNEITTTINECKEIIAKYA